MMQLGLNNEIVLLRSRTDQSNIRRGQLASLQEQSQQLKQQQQQLGTSLQRKYNLNIAIAFQSEMVNNIKIWTSETIASVQHCLALEVCY